MKATIHTIILYVTVFLTASSCIKTPINVFLDTDNVFAVVSLGTDNDSVSLSIAESVFPIISLDSIKRKTGIADLTPTHRVERIVTNDIGLIQYLERDTSIIIYYLPDTDGEGFMNENPAEETNTNFAVECDEHPAPLSSLLTATPFIIVVPIDYTLPKELNSVFLFETFIPQRNQDRDRISKERPVTPAFVTGVLKSFDNRLNAYTPLPNAKIYYYSEYMGETIPAYTYTTASGSFRLETPSMQGTITVSLQNSKFKIREGMSTNIYTMTIGSLSSLLVYPSTYLTLNLPTNFFCDVYKSAQYYFYANNSLLSAVTRYDSCGYSLDIYAVNGPDQDKGYLGYFMPSASPYVVIYNPYTSNYTGASSKVFGTVQHELGHATNYVSVGQTNMNTTDDIIKESFASFFGWYNVSIYYDSIVSSASDVNDICTQGRQTWTLGSTHVSYSPFYVDLFDDYNQHTYLNSGYNDDPISDVAISAIVYLGIGPKTFPAVYYTLSSFIGTYFTGSQYMTFVSPYTPLL